MSYDLEKVYRYLVQDMRLHECGHLCLSVTCCTCDPVLDGYSCAARRCERPVPEGCDIISDRDDWLLLDLDTRWARAQFLKRYDGVHPLRIWPSRNNNLHVVVDLGAPMPYNERLALQLHLGSDSARTGIDLKKTPNMRRNVLFRPRRPWA